MTSGPYLFGRTQTGARRRGAVIERPAERHGVPDHGRIVKLYVGQGYGFIRPGDAPDIYFHRGDLEEGTSINNCQVGDLVSFERVEDLISGPRARYVRRRDKDS